ncbi:hypothetical protein, partial [Clostridioides difficile]|uniref:hypothetical protein n=1 Tax=Clostridioides difficile TaxID=1496 RepID=UPI001A9B901B
NSSPIPRRNITEPAVLISFLKIEIPIAVASKTETSIFLFSRELNNYYRDKLANKLLVKSISKIFFPKSLRFFLIGLHSIKY